VKALKVENVNIERLVDQIQQDEASNLCWVHEGGSKKRVLPHARTHIMVKADLGEQKPRYFVGQQRDVVKSTFWETTNSSSH
jgi:hypothetical protein